MKYLQVKILILLALTYLIISVPFFYTNLSSKSIGDMNNYPELWEVRHEWNNYPYYSPNGLYYVDIEKKHLRPVWVLSIYETETKRKIGRYGTFNPSYLGWVNDSSGIGIIEAGIPILRSGWLFPGWRLFSRPAVIVMLPEKYEHY
ncbi:MAG: hypothetical protein KGZ63_11925 [Clostridiales bacterium]|jgi:hypothetical protein|nr:hypothetical protein [Clostridiales bacterium]